MASMAINPNHGFEAIYWIENYFWCCNGIPSFVLTKTSMDSLKLENEHVNNFIKQLQINMYNPRCK